MGAQKMCWRLGWSLWSKCVLCLLEVFGVGGWADRRHRVDGTCWMEVVERFCYRIWVVTYVLMVTFSCHGWIVRLG